MSSDKIALHRYLWSQYAGIFDEQQMERHLKDYIGLEIAETQVAQLPPLGVTGLRVLDVGCGFGSFVLAARRHGYDCIGIDVADFEITFARTRLREERPEDDPEQVYQLGDGCSLPFAAQSFDVVTLWNVIEHVDAFEVLLEQVERVLRPGGRIYIVCPNYAAFRQEAHYHITWIPLLPRPLAVRYLRWRGKDPHFFETSIYYRTNWSVLRALRRIKLEVHDPLADRLINPEGIRHRGVRKAMSLFSKLRLMWVLRILLAVMFINPFRGSVALYAAKRGRS